MKKITILFGFIILVLAVLCVLLGMGKISFKSTDSNKIDYSELSKFGEANYNYIKDVSNGDYLAYINSNGKVSIVFDIDTRKEISNVSDVKDIVLFSPPSPNSTLYILTLNGDIYEYDMANIKEGKYEAKRVSEYSNIREIVVYKTRKGNVGGCDYLVAIDKNNKYYKIDSFCV